MENHKQVLVVDDEPTICSLMNVFLTQRGYQVHIANTGADALNLFKEALPDIVLLDISMPGMRGIDVLRQIKAINANCGVIMLSAYGDDETIQEAMDMGAFCYIQKPMELTDLNARLEELRHSLTENA
ncbi:MAG: response regulator [Desulfobacterales bacterium]|nr:response regulator [Desulfobacterales bacterium]